MWAASSVGADELPPAVDYLTFARGAVPVAVGGDAEMLKVGIDQALRAIDGDGDAFVLTPKPGGAETVVQLVYRLPAVTRFEELAVPGVLETPSPSQTFVREIDIAGSNAGPDGPFEPLASAILEAHDAKGQETAIPVSNPLPVRWVAVTLRGGLDVQRDSTFFELSEIVGRGHQEPVPLLTAFDGKWKGRGVTLELVQDGATVVGCYDREGRLSGTVTGNILRAVGETEAGIPSSFVLTVGEDGQIDGVRSTNGAPFKRYTGTPVPTLVTACSQKPAQPALGCGSVVHAIAFDFDSAVIRPESADLLDDLYAGLAEADAASIEIVGHTSSEGSQDYNQALSERRATAVVTALEARGLTGKRLSGRGQGEDQPIADNATEAGRALNRRVEIHCR